MLSERSQKCAHVLTHTHTHALTDTHKGSIFEKFQKIPTNLLCQKAEEWVPKTAWGMAEKGQEKG